jgi:hypothetical protein
MRHTRTFIFSVSFFLLLANLTPMYTLVACPGQSKDHKLLFDSCISLHPPASSLMECYQASYCPEEIARAELAICPADHSWALARTVISSTNDSSISTFLAKRSPARFSGLFFHQDFLVDTPFVGPGSVNLPLEPLYILNLSLLI